MDFAAGRRRDPIRPAAQPADEPIAAPYLDVSGIGQALCPLNRRLVIRTSQMFEAKVVLIEPDEISPVAGLAEFRR
jgi:hypothetical protein